MKEIYKNKNKNTSHNNNNFLFATVVPSGENKKLLLSSTRRILLVFFFLLSLLDRDVWIMMRGQLLLLPSYTTTASAASFLTTTRRRTSSRSTFGRRFSILSDEEELNDILNQVIHPTAQENDASSTRSKSSLHPFHSTIFSNTTSNLNEWRTLDWNSLEKHNHSSQPPPSSPVEITLVRDKLVHIKHDECVRLEGGSQVSGNKARKMLSLHELLADDFPSCIVSYGGPQSNAMLALAAIVHFRNNNNNNNNNNLREQYRFVYYTKKLPRFLRQQPSGNLFRAQALGMELVELDHQEYAYLFSGGILHNSPIVQQQQQPPPTLIPPQNGAVWIPQGGACAMALRGCQRLADEIVTYWEHNGRGRPLTVFIPGGTCSTAALTHYYLQQLRTMSHNDDNRNSSTSSSSSSRMDIKVVVIPCIGDEVYALRQMQSLYSQLELKDIDCPEILPPSPKGGRQDSRYFRFGEPDRAILETFLEMRDRHEILLDLLYGSPSWSILLRHWQQPALRNREIMYVHSGGLEGINSQLLRYKYKGLVSSADIQLPGKKGK